MSQMPRTTLRCGFFSDPFTPSPTWTDISSYMTASAGGDIGSTQRSKTRPGVMHVVLDNSTDAFNPWNTASPFYGNLLTQDQSYPTTTAGWVNQANAALSNATVDGFSVLRMTSGGAGNMTAGLSSGPAVIPGKQYTAMASLKAGAATNRLFRIDIQWYSSAPALISTSSGATATSLNTQWTGNTVTATAPANAATAVVAVVVLGAGGAGEVQNVTHAGLNGGSTTTWVIGGLGGCIQPDKRLQLYDEWNLLTANQSYPTATTGWTNQGNASLSNATVGGFSVLRMTSSGAGTMTAGITTGISVTPGQQVSAMASVRAGAATNRLFRVDIQWYSATPSLISTTSSTTDTSLNTAFTGKSVTGTAPANAATAVLAVVILGAGGAGEVQNVTHAGLFDGGNVTDWSLGGPYYRMTGYVENWAAEWETIKSGDTVVRAVDLSKGLTLIKPAKTDYRDAVLADTPTVYYRLSENAQSTTGSGLLIAEDDSGNGYDGDYYGKVSVGHPGALPTEVSTAAEFQRGTSASGGGWVETFISALASGTGNFSIEAWVFPRSFDPAGLDRIWRLLSVGSQNVQLSVLSDGTLRAGFSDGLNGGTLDTSVALTLNRWNHVVAVKSGTTGPANWKIYINKVEVSTGAGLVGTGNVTVTANSGQIGGFDVSGVGQGAFDGFIDEVAVYPSALSSARVTAHYDAGYALVAQALTGARLGKLLDVIGFPTADRTIDAGQFQMQPLVEPIYDTPIYGLIERYSESEGWPACWFIDGAGKFVFQDRAHATPSSSATFTDASGSSLYYDAGPGPNRGDKGLWTEATMQADNGKPQTSRDAPAASRYFGRTLTRTGLLNASDTDVATMAAAEVTRGKTPKDRIERLVIHPIMEPGAMWPQVLGRELNDRITVNRTETPGGGDDFSGDFRIEEIEHRFGAQDWYCTWTLEPT